MQEGEEVGRRSPDRVEKEPLRATSQVVHGAGGALFGFGGAVLAGVAVPAVGLQEVGVLARRARGAGGGGGSGEGASIALQALVGAGVAVLAGSTIVAK